MNKKTKNDLGKSIPYGIGFGTLCALTVMFVGILIITWLLSNERVPEETLGYGVMVISFLSAIVGSSDAVLLVRHHIMPVSVGTCLCFLVVLLGLTALFFGGQYSGVGATALLILGGGIGVALIVIKRFDKPKSYFKKR